MLTAPIYYGYEGFARLRRLIHRKKYSAVFVLADRNTARHCHPPVKRLLPAHHLLVIRGGERAKQLSTCYRLWTALMQRQADRHALLVNLGGGMVCDLGGFVASVYKRGIDFVHVPTTLLAQADAALGGKTGVDAGPYKNMIGTFSRPQAVVMWPRFLQTLPARQVTAGFSEIVKHALIADAAAFRRLTALNKLPADTMPWIRFSEKVKSRIVRQDPYELAARKALNFGHTIGHALESLFLKKKGRSLLHGEAVAAGMVAEAFISYEQKLLTDSELDVISRYIRRHYRWPLLSSADMHSIAAMTKQDKKNRGGSVRMTLLKHIGGCRTDRPVAGDQVTRSLRYLNFVRQ